MKMCLVLLVVAAFAGVATTPRLQAQSLADTANSSSPVVTCNLDAYAGALDCGGRARTCRAWNPDGG